MRRTPPTRRVAILRDTGQSPLWYLKCAKPCEAGGGDWCMGWPHTEQQPHCYLGGAMSPEGARTIAERAGYEVVE